MLNLNAKETYQEAGEILLSRLARAYQQNLENILACGALSEEDDPMFVAKHVLALTAEKLIVDKRFLGNLRNFI